MTRMQCVIQRNISPPGHTETQLLDDELLGELSKDDEPQIAGISLTLLTLL